MQLIIGNKNYSSWSLRPWVLLKYFEIDFSEKTIWLFSSTMHQELAALSPNLKVPVLVDDEVKVWDSLAICEYINEQYLADKALPQDRPQRAAARSLCAQMHSGFMAMRDALPMNCRRAVASIEISAAAQQDIEQVVTLLEATLVKQRSKKVSHGDFLFGAFSLADAYYLPVMSRFEVYNIALPKVLLEYQQMMLALPAYQEWLSHAAKEQAVIVQAEV